VSDGVAASMKGRPRMGGDRGQGGVIEPVEQPPPGRVRRHRPERRRLVAQHGDLGIGGAPSATATARSTSIRPESCRERGRRSPPQGLGEFGRQGRPVRDVGQQTGPGVRHHPRPIRGHDDLRTIAVTCIWKMPPRPRWTWPSTSPVLPGREALSSFAVTYSAAPS
jgi:hypothetical protein